MNDCAFCSIIAGALPAEVVLDEPDAVAFLDRRPLFPGHVLVVPREHVPTVEDVADALLEPLFGTVRRVAAAVRVAVGAEGTFVAANNVVSQSVPHLHVHVVPRSRGDGLRGFFWPRTGYESAEHRARIAAAIREALA
jgi:histidine triad (HIT) family protein